MIRTERETSETNKLTDRFPCQTAPLTLPNDTVALEPLRRLVNLSERREFRVQMAGPEGAGQLGGLEVVQHDERKRARFYHPSQPIKSVFSASQPQPGKGGVWGICATHSSCISWVSVIGYYPVARDINWSRIRIWPADGSGSPAETYPALKRSSLP